MLMKQILQAVGVAVALPGILLSWMADSAQTTGKPVAGVVETAPEIEETVKLVYIPVIRSDGRLEAMELEEYVSRVVLGEMPMNFEVEALKAQAVATRTYTMRRVQRGDKHNGAVCTDYACCQSYREPEDYLEKGGTQEKLDRLRDAVEQTRGQVLCYDGELISATYFASAGGATEDAAAVWGSSVPYLVSVSSPDAALEKSLTFKPKEFQSKLGVILEGNPTQWFGKITYTEGGGVKSIQIGGKTYTGTKLRSLLGLRSTVFTVTAKEDSVTFSTQGFGHRVGMSQYGADAMAVTGSTYDKILLHYYPGTALTKL